MMVKACGMCNMDKYYCQSCGRYSAVDKQAKENNFYPCPYCGQAVGPVGA